MRLFCSISALLLLAFAGCATFTSHELASIRSRGVPPHIVAKLDREQPLTPAEITLLSQRGVPDSQIERYLESAGVDYLASRAEIIQMRRGGVSARVIDALLRECELFASDYAPGARSTWALDSVHYSSSVDPYWW